MENVAKPRVRTTIAPAPTRTLAWHAARLLFAISMNAVSRSHNVHLISLVEACLISLARPIAMALSAPPMIAAATFLNATTVAISIRIPALLARNIKEILIVVLPLVLNNNVVRRVVRL